MTNPLSAACEVYALPGWAEDPKGICMPDCVVAALLAAVRPVAKSVYEKHLALERKEVLPALNRHRILIPAPQLSWDQSCKIAVSALEAGIPPLGERARYVADAKKRWKVVSIEAGDSWGRCIYPDDATREKARIEFGSDGTISDAVYIAHEMGHLLAGDMSQERKLTGKDYYPRKSVAELQSFVTQHAFYAYLMRDKRASFLRHEGQVHYVAEVTRSLYHCAVAQAALEAHRLYEKGAKEKTIRETAAETLEKLLGEEWSAFRPAAWLAENGAENLVELQNLVHRLHQHASAAIIGAALYERYAGGAPERKDRMLEALYCGGNRTNVLDVLAAADAATPQALDALMSEGVWAAAEPLQQLHVESRSPKRSGAEG